MVHLKMRFKRLFALEYALLASAMRAVGADPFTTMFFACVIEPLMYVVEEYTFLRAWVYQAHKWG
jgi:hypothetical protein